MFPSLKTQKFEWWMMETENRILVFSVSEIWVMVAKSELCDWVMWPNNNFGVFEIKWGLGWVMGFELELWVMSYEYWVIKTESWPNQMSSCFLCEKLLHLYAIGFCNWVLPDLHFWWSEELCNQQHLFKLLELVTYLGSV